MAVGGSQCVTKALSFSFSLEDGGARICRFGRARLLLVVVVFDECDTVVRPSPLHQQEDCPAGPRAARALRGVPCWAACGPRPAPPQPLLL